MQMDGYEGIRCGFEWWWIFPLLMITLCFFMRRGKRGSMMCGFNSRREDNQRLRRSDSAKDLLDKRYALGEISKEEYEERKRDISRTDS